ncbi:hypothetical protein [Algivirga pacifica]|uniref:hypothetical protein n=1 Tax=Algivirga pacifica TaxID=1162670 RepID=UPI0031F0041C
MSITITIQQLFNQGLLTHAGWATQIKEQQALARLCRKPSTYLNLYDQLFRQLSLLLLREGYNFSNYKPHQALKALCSLYLPQKVVEQLIAHRHALKYKQVAKEDEELKRQLRELLRIVQCMGR